MTRGWLPAWGLTAVAYGGGSLIVPLYLVELGGTAFDLGVLFATGSFVGVPAALVFGALADRTGKRRPFVFGAMATAVAAMLAIPLLERIGLVVLANAALWFGFAAAVPVLTLLAVAGEPEAEWSGRIARLNKFQGIGWALGLAIGFVVVAAGTRLVDTITGQRWFFFVCAASASAGFVLAVRALPPDPRSGAGPEPRRLRRRVRDATRFNVRGASFPFAPSRFDARELHPRRFVDRFTPRLGIYFVAVLLAFTGFGVFFAPLPAYLAAAGYGSSEIFALYLLLNAGAAAFYGPAAAIVERHDLVSVHVGGLLARAVAFPLIAAAGLLGGSLLGSGVVAALFLVVGLAWAVIAVTATTLVTRLSPAAIRGEALGVYGALGAVGGGIGGLLGGWLAGAGYLIAFGVAGGLVAAGTGTVLALSAFE